MIEAYMSPLRKDIMGSCDSVPNASDTAASYSSIRMMGFAPNSSINARDRTWTLPIRSSSEAVLSSSDSKRFLTDARSSFLSRRWRWGSKHRVTALRMPSMNLSYVSALALPRARWITGNAFLYLSYSGNFDISNPSNHVFPSYRMLKKASSIVRFVVFPNLRGRTNRYTPESSVSSRSPIRRVLST